MVSEVTPREARLSVARLLCMERHAGQIQGRAYHLQGLRDVELGVGSGGQGLLLASLLLASTRFEFRQSGRSRSAVQGPRVLAETGRGRVSSRCDPVSLRAR